MTTEYDSLNSPHNGDSALKDSHNKDAQAIRTTNTGLPFGATSFVGVVDVYGNYTSITYYSDTAAEKTTVDFVADVSSSLNDTYFIIYSGKDKTKYYVWYNVGAAGTDPALSGATGVEVVLVANDAAAVVALATKNAIVTAALPFSNVLDGDSVALTANLKGDTTDSTAETSGFTVTTNIQGVTEVVATVTLTYDANCNVIGYEQNIGT